MDLKKIKVSDGLDFIDGLIEKIPERVSDVLKKFAITIFAITTVYVAYTSYQKGKDLAVQEGQDLAKDTKMLFYEEVERAYNHKKKGGIRFQSSSDHLLSDTIHKIEKKYIDPRESTSPQNIPVVPPENLLNRDSEMRPAQNPESGNLLNVQPESLHSTEISNPQKERKIPRKDNFDLESDLNLDSDYYSRTLGESVGRNKILQKKPKDSSVPIEDPTLLKNEIPKPEKKNRLVSPPRKQVPGEMIPIEN
jgi:hypothetical protein